MKRIVCLCSMFFILCSAFTQSKDGVIKVRKRVGNTPSIAGVSGGEVEGILLCSGEGIIINKKIKVISFVFIAEHGSKEITIKHNGNELNKEACDIIALLKSGAEIFFNEITVLDERGIESLTTPMRLKLK